MKVHDESVVIKFKSLNPTHHQKIKEDHDPEICKPRTFTCFRFRQDQSILGHEWNIFNTVIIIMHITYVWIDEKLFFCYKSCISLRRVVNMFVSIKSSHVQECQIINCASRWWLILTNKRNKMLNCMMSIYFSLWGFCWSIFIYMNFILIVITLNIESNNWIRLSSPLNICHNLRNSLYIA